MVSSLLTLVTLLCAAVAALDAQCGADGDDVCTVDMANFDELDFTLDGDATTKLGIKPNAYPPELVSIKEASGPAATAGMRKRDQLLTINGLVMVELDEKKFKAELQKRPVHLTVRRLKPLNSTDEVDILRRFGGKRCYIGTGSDMPWSPKEMTIYDAYSLCSRITSCRGFTSNVGGGPFSAQRKYPWHFKQKYECFENGDWLAFAMFKEDAQPVPEEDPWVVPDLEWLRSEPNVTFLSNEPPIIMLDGFLADVEIEHVLGLARPLLVRSTVGMGRGVDNARTSSTSWLDQMHHWKDPILQAIDARITKLTNVPRRNMEHHQVLRYEGGEQYTRHNDFIIEQKSQKCGPRIATFFMYLNDVEEGGATRFHNIDLTVTPKKGQALLWWNLNLTAMQAGVDPMDLGEDSRVEHAALPVTAGEKWSVNKWLHLHDFANHHRLGLL